MPAPGKDLRWEGDARGEGVASAGPAATNRLESLRIAAKAPTWVAGEPEIHLWPKLAAAIESEGSPWSAARHSVDHSGRFAVELAYGGTSSSDLGRFRRDARVVVEVVTGMLDDQTPFRSHGHM